MEWLHLSILGPVVAGFTNSILGTLIYLKKDRKDRTNLFFSLFIFSIVGWGVSMIFFIIAQSANSAAFFAPLMYISAAFILYFFLLFTFNFPSEGRRISNKEFIIITIPFVFVCLLSLIPGQIINEIHQDYGYNAIRLGRGYVAYTIYIVGYFILGLLNLIKNYRRANGILKIHAASVLIGILIPFLVGVTMDLFLPWFGYWRYIWVGPTATIIIGACIFLAMQRYRLFNLKIILFENQYLVLIKKGEEGDLLEKAKRGY